MIHYRFDVKTAKKRAVDLFKELALPDPEHIGQRYPNQVSGGQLQRMMAAMALINDPDVVIFDEPTTALDVTTQIEVLRAFRAAIRDRHTTAIYVSHDLAVVAQMADDILVLKNGEMQEIGPTDQVIESPKDPCTAELLAARQPKLLDDRFATVQSQAIPLIQLSHVHAGYGKKNAAGEHEVSILHDISLKMYRGQSIGIIGESGSGKTTLAGVIAGLMSPSRGEIVFEGKLLPPKLVSRDQETLRKIQMVFQSADTALNPQMTIEQILARPLRFFHGLTGSPLHLRVQSLLSLVKLPSGVANRLPGELSGGQKQRVNLARALAAEPDLILCDEVTSALDTIVGAAILDLIVELRRELNLSVLFISHDLNTVRAVCDEIVVMQRGHIVTRVPRADYQVPAQHPYYKQLTDSVPELRRDWLDSL